MQGQVVLVMCLGGIKLLQRHDLGDDGRGISVRGGKFQDAVLRKFFRALRGIHTVVEG